MSNIDGYGLGGVDKMTNRELIDDHTPSIDTPEEEIHGASSVVRVKSLSLSDLKNNLAMHAMQADLCYDPAKGIFPGASGRFPSSRDWHMPTIECGTKTCAANYKGKCVMPSCIKIGANGKCLGNHPRKVAKKRKK